MKSERVVRRGTPGGEIDVLLLHGESLLLTDALFHALEVDDSIRLLGRPVSEPGLVDVVSDRHPQVILLDAVGWSIERVAERVRQIMAADTFVRVLVLTSMRSKERCLVDAVDAGASGVLSPDLQVDQLVESIRRVARGERLVDAQHYLDAVETTSRLRASEHEARERLRSLTGREEEVLGCLLEGLATSDIAERFRISVRTVDTHVHHILRKLSVHRRIDAVRVAMRASTWAAPHLRDSA